MEPSIVEALKFLFSLSHAIRGRNRTGKKEICHAAPSDSMTNDERRGG